MTELESHRLLLFISGVEAVAKRLLDNHMFFCSSIYFWIVCWLSLGQNNFHPFLWFHVTEAYIRTPVLSTVRRYSGKVEAVGVFALTFDIKGERS
jgi:hypothetical protein